MSEIGIVMAAGLGTRLLPLTKKIPKPLIKVNGKPMIETVLDGLEARGVDEIVVVVGYQSEQFVYLTGKYNNLRIVENKDYNTVNNISSIYAVSDILIKDNHKCFICEADLVITDISIFICEIMKSCYFGKKIIGRTDDWVMDVNERGRIVRIGKSGQDTFGMVGITYLMENDANMLGSIVKKIYGTEGFEGMFMDDVINDYISKFDLVIHEVKNDQIVEIDTLKELKEVDKSYR